MFLLGYIGAPPTMTVIAAKTGAAAKGAAKARPAASSVARRVILAFMFGSVVIFSSRPFDRDVSVTEREARSFRHRGNKCGQRTFSIARLVGDPTGARRKLRRPIDP